MNAKAYARPVYMSLADGLKGCIFKGETIDYSEAGKGQSKKEEVSRMPGVPPEPRGHRVAQYDAWVAEQQIPIHRGYYVDDLKTVEVAPWSQRGTRGCFLELAGQEGWTQICVQELPPGATSRPFKMALDELIFVANGRGVTTLWAEGRGKVNFEWNKFSLFMIPGNFWCQLSNMDGTAPARMLHYSYLPMAMECVRDREILFNCPKVDQRRVYEPENFYSEAQAVSVDGVRKRNIWRGNFFPDILAWDKMDDNTDMGVGRKLVWLRFPDSPMWAHIGESEAFTYKKAHRHGPGTIVIFLNSEGYSLMWPEGQEKVVCPWKEGSAIVPPNGWFHHHFVLDEKPAKMLALHRSRLHPGLGDNVVDYERNEIQYWQEDPEIRRMFEEKLAERGYSSRMPAECYEDKDFDPNWGRQGKKPEGAVGAKKGYSTDFSSRTSDYLREREIS